MQNAPHDGGVYLEQGDYEHAEPYLLQATDIEETLQLRFAALAEWKSGC